MGLAQAHVLFQKHTDRWLALFRSVPPLVQIKNSCFGTELVQAAVHLLSYNGLSIKITFAVNLAQVGIFITRTGHVFPVAELHGFKASKTG